MRRPPTARLASAARFVFLTAVCLLVIELALRRYVPDDFFWKAVAQSPRPVDVLFIGSSRTAAAIDPGTFAASLPGSAVTVVNAGTGFVTPAEFFLALRNTLRDQPQTLRDTVLAIEAAAAMPDPQSWSDRWAHADRPAILIPVLRASDLPRYWQASRPFEEKLQVSVTYLLRHSSVVTRRDAIGARLFGKGHIFLQSRLASLLPAPQQPAAQSDLTTAGGIRTDSEGVLLARRLAEDYARASMGDQRPIDWPGTVVADIIRLAREHRLRVVFFAPPLHSLHRRIYETPRRDLDRQAFGAFAARIGTPILAPVFPTSDEDFPDIWHLKKSLAAPYTRALAASFLTAGQLR